MKSTRAAGEMRRKLYVYWCWIYFGLGVCCLGGGIYLGLVALQTKPRSPAVEETGVIALVLVFFGLLRAGLALYRLRKLNSRPRLNIGDARQS